MIHCEPLFWPNSIYVWKKHDFVFIAKDIVLEEPNLKIEDKKVPGVYTYTYL